VELTSRVLSSFVTVRNRHCIARYTRLLHAADLVHKSPRLQHVVQLNDPFFIEYRCFDFSRTSELVVPPHGTYLRICRRQHQQS
jgi:hypothetical protein